MLINVKMMNGNGHSVEVQEENTIKDLKELLVDKCGWAPADQKLIYRGRVLQDTQTCKDANFENGITLHLVERPLRVPVESTERVVEDTLDPEPGHAHGMHGFHIETTPEMVGISAIPPHTDPAVAGRHRVDDLHRILTRLEELLGPYERAGQPDQRDPTLEIFRAHPSRRLRLDTVDPAIREADEQAVLRYRSEMLKLLQIVERFLPLADIVSQAVASPRAFTLHGMQIFQEAYDSMVLLLHEISHAFHGMSDFVADFSRPPGRRSLRVPQRVQVEHRALLSTAITIPMTAVGAPNIGNLIAQQLTQLPGAQGGIPVIGMSIQTTNEGPPQQNNRQNLGNRTTGGNPSPPSSGQTSNGGNNSGQASNAGNNPGQTSNGGNNPGLQNDVNSIRDRLSQSIAERVQSLIGQIENRGQSNINVRAASSNNPEASELTRILACTSHLIEVAGNPAIPETLSQRALRQFPSRFVPSHILANDLLTLAFHPLIYNLMKHILQSPNTSVWTEEDLERDVEPIVVELLSPISYALNNLVFTEDHRCFEMVVLDIRKKLMEEFILVVKRLRCDMFDESEYDRRKYGLMRLFQNAAPVFMQYLKAVFGEDYSDAKRYFKYLSEKAFPFGADGTKVLLQDELLRLYTEADESLCPYHGGKIKRLRKSPSPDSEAELMDAN